jgi:hypothetical protein
MYHQKHEPFIKDTLIDDEDISMFLDHNVDLPSSDIHQDFPDPFFEEEEKENIDNSEEKATLILENDDLNQFLEDNFDSQEETALESNEDLLSKREPFAKETLIDDEDISMFLDHNVDLPSSDIHQDFPDPFFEEEEKENIDNLEEKATLILENDDLNQFLENNFDSQEETALESNEDVLSET